MSGQRSRGFYRRRNKIYGKAIERKRQQDEMERGGRAMMMMRAWLLRTLQQYREQQARGLAGWLEQDYEFDYNRRMNGRGWYEDEHGGPDWEFSRNEFEN